MTAATVPQPYSWPPSEYWDGVDGLWSSFDLRVGTPTQNVRVLISTAGQATWVISPLFCNESSVPSCDQDADGGGTFNNTKSRSWRADTWRQLGLEKNLYPADTGGSYGLDRVTLGISNFTTRPGLPDQVVASIEAATDWFFTGMFGIGPEPTNFTTFDNSTPSFLSTLRTENWIPSLSWSYTAGASYRDKRAFGSLIFGGYDKSRFIYNNVSFYRAEDRSRDLVVGLQSINATDSSGFNISLLSSPIPTLIDSTIPYIYLPTEVCEVFEKTYGLIWNQDLRLYSIDDKTHEKLLKLNPTFKFTIGDSTQSKSTVDIFLPYASFDLVANPPLADRPDTRYFPLNRAANKSQFTLGRTFLQESYIIMNYEYDNFSVFQTKFEDGLENDIVSILPKQSANTISTFPHITPGHGPGSVTRVVTAGIVFGTVGFLVVGFLIVGFFVQRWRYSLSENETLGRGIADEGLTKSEDSTHQRVFSLQEIATRSVCEMPDSGKVELQGDAIPINFGFNSSDLEQIDDNLVFKSSGHQSVTKIFIRSGSKATRRFAIYLPTEGISGSWVRQYRPTTSQNNLLVPTSPSQSRLPKSLDLRALLPSRPLRNSRRIRRKSI